MPIINGSHCVACHRDVTVTEQYLWCRCDDCGFANRQPVPTFCNLCDAGAMTCTPEELAFDLELLPLSPVARGAARLACILKARAER